MTEYTGEMRPSAAFNYFLPPEYHHLSVDALYKAPMTFLERYFPRGCSFWTGRKLYFEKQQRQTKRSQQNLFDALVVHTDETDQQLLNTPRENLRAEQWIRREVLEREGKVKDGQQLTWRNRSRDKDKLKELRELAGEARERLPKMLRIADLTNATIAVLDRIVFIIRQEKRTKISYTELENRLPCSRSSIQRAVKVLEKLAVLLVKREKNFKYGKPCNEINEYTIVRYKEQLLRKPDRLTADDALSFSEGGSVNVETHSVENFNSHTTDITRSVSKGVRAHRGKAPARTSSKEKPHETAKASSQIKKSSLSPKGDRKKQPRKLTVGSENVTDFLDLATRACQFLDPDRDLPRTWEAVSTRTIELWEKYFDDLPQANWHITGEKRGDKLRSLIAIETALMKRIGAIHTSASRFFIGVATKPAPAIAPQTTISRILDHRDRKEG